MGHSGRSQRVQRRLTMVHEDAAGLDVGSTFHVLAVPADRDAEPVRTFQSFTADLHALAEWLQAVGIRTIAMESTGVYWIPVYEILEQRVSRCCSSMRGPPPASDALTSRLKRAAPA